LENDTVIDCCLAAAATFSLSLFTTDLQMKELQFDQHIGALGTSQI
jgi:hypothetical protein